MKVHETCRAFRCYLKTERRSCAQASGQAAGASLDSKEVLSRLRLLQSHLCGYAQRSVPVVNLDLANFNDTLDGLHDYLLLCIQMALEEDEAQESTGLSSAAKSEFLGHDVP